MLYKYKISYYDADNSKYITPYGIIFADNFSDAIEKLTQYYEEDCIAEILSLRCVSDNICIELSDEVTKEKEKMFNILFKEVEDKSF